jgi:hypothetical protein
MKNDIEKPNPLVETDIKELENFLPPEDRDRVAKLRELLELQAKTLSISAFANDETKRETELELIGYLEKARRIKAEQGK